MGEHEHFDYIPEQLLDRKPVEDQPFMPRRTFAEETREIAGAIVAGLAMSRIDIGLSEPIGRLGLIPGVGTNRTEVDLHIMAKAIKEEED